MATARHPAGSLLERNGFRRIPPGSAALSTGPALTSADGAGFTRFRRLQPAGAVFKTGERRAAPLAGSIPVRLRWACRQNCRAGPAERGGDHLSTTLVGAAGWLGYPIFVDDHLDSLTLARRNARQRPNRNANSVTERDSGHSGMGMVTPVAGSSIPPLPRVVAKAQPCHNGGHDAHEDHSRARGDGGRGHVSRIYPCRPGGRCGHRPAGCTSRHVVRRLALAGEDWRGPRPVQSEPDGHLHVHPLPAHPHRAAIIPGLLSGPPVPGSRAAHLPA